MKGALNIINPEYERNYDSIIKTDHAEFLFNIGYSKDKSFERISIKANNFQKNQKFHANLSKEDFKCTGASLPSILWIKMCLTQGLAKLSENKKTNENKDLDINLEVIMIEKDVINPIRKLSAKSEWNISNLKENEKDIERNIKPLGGLLVILAIKSKADKIRFGLCIQLPLIMQIQHDHELSKLLSEHVKKFPTHSQNVLKKGASLINLLGNVRAHLDSPNYDNFQDMKARLEKLKEKAKSLLSKPEEASI